MPGGQRLRFLMYSESAGSCQLCFVVGPRQTEGPTTLPAAALEADARRQLGDREPAVGNSASRVKCKVPLTLCSPYNYLSKGKFYNLRVLDKRRVHQNVAGIHLFSPAVSDPKCQDFLQVLRVRESAKGKAPRFSITIVAINIVYLTILICFSLGVMPGGTSPGIGRAERFSSSSADSRRPRDEKGERRRQRQHPGDADVIGQRDIAQGYRLGH